MTRPAKGILNAAIKLAERDRLQIVEELLASLEPANDEDVDAAWAEEIERRSSQIRKVAFVLSRAEEVKSQARKRLRGRN